MDARYLDHLSRLVAQASTRRALLGVGAAIGLAAAPGEAKKRKKKCKAGTKKCWKRCIPSSGCCTSAECAPGGTCQDGTCTSPTPTATTTPAPAPFCAGKPDNPPVFCGERPWVVEDLSTWYFCQGGACGLVPDCEERSRPCGGNPGRCCSWPTTTCSTQSICGCSSEGLPCKDTTDCCGHDSGWYCAGFVCRRP